MKRLIFFLGISLGVISLYGQDYFMYVGSEKRYFKVSPNKILVQFAKNTETDTIKNIVEKNTFFLTSSISKVGSKDLNLVSFLDTNKAKVIELAKQWNKDEKVLYSSVVFIDEDGEVAAALSNQVIVRLKQESDSTILQASIQSYDIDNIRQDEFDKKSYLLRINSVYKKNAMQIANELYETGLFDIAEPDLILFIKYAAMPNDPYFHQQWWAYNSIYVPSINAPAAWNITTGSPNIKIAILDRGVDLGHPDLQDNLLPGYDATAGGNNNGNHSGCDHGTLCAGVAAARGNNSRGIAGTAYNCKILPIHMGYPPLTSEIINGLNWAVANGADVISMSFGGFDFSVQTPAYDTAISRAVNLGRNNKGCVLVASSGGMGFSSRPQVLYPAKHKSVLSVGAINNQGIWGIFF